MKIIVSTPKTGGLTMTEVIKHESHFHLYKRNEINKRDKSHYIQKLVTFELNRRHYTGVARRGGVVQLYNTTHDDNFELIKEWKGASANCDDPVVALKYTNGHLYSCSGEGKVVMRDLNDDDSMTSYIVNYIRKPVSAFEIHPSNPWIIASAGKDNELEVCELNIDGVVPHPCMLSRRATLLNFAENIETTCARLTPFWKAVTAKKDIVYNTEHETISNWINNIIFLESNDEDVYKMVCSTRFGSILVYDSSRSKYPIKDIRISTFPISSIRLLPNSSNYLLYSDVVSRVGVLNLRTNVIINEYDIPTGAISSMEVLTYNGWNSDDMIDRDHDLVLSESRRRKISSLSRISLMDPIILVISNISKELLVYKLMDNNKKELLCSRYLESILPCVCVVDRTKSYNYLFGNLHRSASSRLFNDSFRLEEFIHDDRLEGIGGDLKRQRLDGDKRV